jgi:hypothetical protein
MPHAAKLRLLAAALAAKPRIRIGVGRSLVAALLTMDVLLAIAARIGRRPGAVLLALAHASGSVPSTGKCSLDSSVFSFG